MVRHWVYYGSSYAVRNFKSCSVVKLVILYYWDVAWTKQPVLSIAVLFIEGASIEKEKKDRFNKVYDSDG